jgi:hypothetical protein
MRYQKLSTCPYFITSVCNFFKLNAVVPNVIRLAHIALQLSGLLIIRKLTLLPIPHLLLKLCLGHHITVFSLKECYHKKCHQFHCIRIKGWFIQLSNSWIFLFTPISVPDEITVVFKILFLSWKYESSRSIAYSWKRRETI